MTLDGKTERGRKTRLKTGSYDAIRQSDDDNKIMIFELKVITMITENEADD